MIDSATAMAGVRPDSNQFIEVMKFTAEQLKTLKPWDLTPKEEWDAAIRYAMRGLEKKWKAKAKAEGIKKGKKEGIEEGIKEGIMAGKYQVVRNLAQMGLSIADISQAVELPPETVQNVLSLPHDVPLSDA
jgi:predicted transposase/invertase (TIGR01784 family)